MSNRATLDVGSVPERTRHDIARQVFSGLLRDSKSPDFMAGYEKWKEQNHERERI